MNDGSDLPPLLVAPTASRASAVTFCGNVDGVHGRCVDGWVFDPENPAHPVIVQILDFDRLLGEAPAGLFRADLAAAKIGDGNHSFRFLLPLELFDGQQHEIHVRIRGHDHVLSGTPCRLSTHPLTANAAFRLPDNTGSSPPLSDLQFTMLRALHALTDALLAQTKALQDILQRQPSSGTAVPSSTVPANQDGPTCPLIAEAMSHAGGEHDYLIFSIIDWNFRIQRPQHIAQSIARLGNRVFYLSIRFEPFETGQRRFSIRSVPAEGVFEVALCCRPPAPSIYGGLQDPMQIEELRAALAALVSELRLKSPVGIVQFPSWLPVAAWMPGMLMVFDCMDHLAGFTNVAPPVVELEMKLIQKSDCVLVTSKFLARMVARERSCRMLRNAAEVSYFSRCPERLYQPISRPLIGYYGAIADWFDIDLVTECARRRTDWRFVLIGEVTGCDISVARSLDNVEFLGEKPYDELTFYLYAFDVCIIPFKLVDLTKATNPVKVYEYLCAGKPVVATNLPELQILPPGTVTLASSLDEFENGIAQSLERDGPKPADLRRRWAERHSWDARARKLSRLIASHYPRVSVIVLCHNNLQFTQACLSSLIDFSDYAHVEFIFVDNASSDGTRAYLEEMAARHSFIRYVRSQENQGFAAGNNVGMRVADGDILILLNNDTFVTRGWILDLIRPMLRDPQIGLCGPVTNNIGNEQKIAIAYSDMKEMAEASALITSAHRHMTYDVERLAFFCVAIRRDVIDRVGVLDETFRLGFFEDDDYCVRARMAGYRLVVCDDVFVHHHLSASFGQLETPERAALMRRNRDVFEAKWGTWSPHQYRSAESEGAQR